MHVILRIPIACEISYLLGSMDGLIVPVRIFLAEAHEELRQAMKGILHLPPSQLVVAETGDSRELLRNLRDKDCDLLVLDLTMPGVHTLVALKIITAEYPQIRSLVLSGKSERIFYHRVKESGAWGYLMKEDIFENLEKACRIIAGGQRYLTYHEDRPTP